ncbi:MAG TPA: family 43 glycosylhydrolase [Candidatus Didemnitutus sp.]|nr:family 43 glycosylhydrolase [Candidatus Didemnitutus sp.]
MPFRFLIGIVAALAAATLPAQTPTFSNVSVHDPSVIVDHGTYYVFGSHLASASSTDLLHWTQITNDWDATSNPTCVLIRNSSPQTEFAAALSYTTPPAFWGPDVVRLGDGRYYYYYCVCNNTSKAALGLAVADGVTGPYANVGILLESGMSGLSPDGTPYNNAVHPNVVDPTTFFDHTGKLWMVYGSFSGGIFILSLDPATGQPYSGQAYGKRLTGGNNCTIEGSYILYQPVTGYYYLFMTYGQLDASGGYNIRVGRSLQPDGPYLDSAGNDLTTVKGAPNTVFDNASIAPYGVKLMGNYQFLHASGQPLTTSRGYVSPGGVSFSYDATLDRTLMFFHTRFVGQGEYHEVRVHQVFWNADGWPVVAPQRFAQEAIATTDPAQVTGDFKLINHGKDITATVKTSTLGTFNADHSISGANAGTWQIAGDHFATITVGGVEYHGVFMHVWDDDNQIWTLGFSALAADGTALWGTKVTAVTATPTIAAQPADQSVPAGTTATFYVGASGAASYQWQQSSDSGSTWTTLTDGGSISGSATSQLSVASVSAAQNGWRYRVVVANGAGSVTSNAATLSLAVGTDLISYDAVTFPAHAAPGAAFSVQCTVTNQGSNAWGSSHYLVLRDDSDNNLAFASLAGVAPGGSTTVTLGATAPIHRGTYVYHLQGLENNVAWFASRTTESLSVSVLGPDFNGDGHVDVLWENTAGIDRALWYLNGTNISGFDYLAGIAAEWRIVGTADFDGDGQTDIAWEDTTTGDRTCWFMNGKAIASFGYFAQVDPAWHIAAIGDFDGDGKPDLVWENTSTGDRAVWYLNGTTVKSFGYIAGVSTDWHIVGAADFNGDGQTDLVWENLVTGDRTIWFMYGATLSSFGYIGNVPAPWHLAMVADFDGDGQPDLLWENRTTGDRAIWLMNGSSLASMTYLAYVDPVWRIAP